MSQVARVQDFEPGHIPLSASPTTVGELRVLLENVPANTRLFDEYSEPPVLTLHYRAGRVQCIEIGG